MIMVCDETITGFGRLGEYFASTRCVCVFVRVFACVCCAAHHVARHTSHVTRHSSRRYGVVPDIITCGKGMTSGYFPMGAMIANEKLYEPFRYGTSTPNIQPLFPYTLNP